MRKLKGIGFLISGLVLGIVGAVVSVTAIVMSGVGIAKSRPISSKEQQ